MLIKIHSYCEIKQTLKANCLSYFGFNGRQALSGFGPYFKSKIFAAAVLVLVFTLYNRPRIYSKIFYQVTC